MSADTAQNSADHAFDRSPTWEQGNLSGGTTDQGGTEIQVPGDTANAAVRLRGGRSGGLAGSAWPKFHRDPENTGQSPYNGSQTNNLLWHYTTGGSIYSPPAIGTDGTIYFGSWDRNIYALNPDGTKKWNFTTGDSIQGSPAIDTDGTIYIGSYDQNVYALYANGTKKWNFTAGDDVSSSPAIGSDGTIYFGCMDCKIYALSPGGIKKWTYTTGRYIVGSPAIGADGTVYIGSFDKYFYALNPNGTKKWDFTTGGYVVGSPVIGSDGTIYFGSGDGNLYALYPDKTKKWNFTTAHLIYSSPAIGTDGTIYFGSNDKKVHALYPNGTENWNYTTGNNIESSPAIGADGTIYIGGFDKNIYALYPNGTKKWHYTTGGVVDSSPAIGADGTLFIGSHDKNLYAFNDTGGPVASFTASPVSGTAPLTVQFTDTSTGTVTAWLWNLGDSRTNTTQNPVHTYISSGNYSVNLTVTGPGGSDHLLRTNYIAVSGGVKVLSVSPASSLRGKTASLALTGDNFTSGSSVNLTRGSDVIQATNVVVTGGKKITCKAAIPGNASTGPYDVIVTNNLGYGGILPGGFTVLAGPAPTISTLTPNTMYPNATWNFTLSGTNFQAGANVTFNHTTFGKLAATASVVDQKKITGTLSLPLAGTTGSWDLTVTNPDGGATTKKNALAVKPWGSPAVTSLLPATVYKNATTSLVLNGKNFQPGLTTVLFNMTGQPDIPLTNLTVVSPTKITGNISVPSGPMEGKWKAVVTTTDGGTGMKNNAITIKNWPKPTISTVTPNKAFINSTISFTIGGMNFQPGAAVCFNRSGGSPELLVPLSYVVVNEKKITGTLTIPSTTPPDKWNVVVVTYDGGMTIKSKGFQVTLWPLPTIGTITPASGTKGTPVNFNLTGTNFQADATTVTFNKTGSADVLATGITVISAIKLNGTVTLPDTGKWSLFVTTIDGGTSVKKSNAFTVK